MVMEGTIMEIRIIFHNSYKKLFYNYINCRGVFSLILMVIIELTKPATQLINIPKPMNKYCGINGDGGVGLFYLLLAI